MPVYFIFPSGPHPVIPQKTTSYIFTGVRTLYKIPYLRVYKTHF
jgi:hypothetical protein